MSAPPSIVSLGVDPSARQRPTHPTGDFAALERDLRPRLHGELRTDRLSRALYATDASIYEIVPDGVLLPKTADDIVAAVELCGRYGVPLTARDRKSVV